MLTCICFYGFTGALYATPRFRLGVFLIVVFFIWLMANIALIVYRSIKAAKLIHLRFKGKDKKKMALKLLADFRVRMIGCFCDPTQKS